MVSECAEDSFLMTFRRWLCMESTLKCLSVCSWNLGLLFLPWRVAAFALPSGSLLSFQPRSSQFSGRTGDAVLPIHCDSLLLANASIQILKCL